MSLAPAPQGPSAYSYGSSSSPKSLAPAPKFLSLRLARCTAGDDWGSDFLLYFCLGTGLYVVGSVGYNHKTGKDLLPHPEFWGSISGLVKDVSMKPTTFIAKSIIFCPFWAELGLSRRVWPGPQSRPLVTRARAGTCMRPWRKRRRNPNRNLMSQKKKCSVECLQPLGWVEFNGRRGRW